MEQVVVYRDFLADPNGGINGILVSHESVLVLFEVGEKLLEGQLPGSSDVDALERSTVCSLRLVDQFGESRIT